MATRCVTSAPWTWLAGLAGLAIGAVTLAGPSACSSPEDQAGGPEAGAPASDVLTGGDALVADTTELADALEGLPDTPAAGGDSGGADADDVAGADSAPDVAQDGVADAESVDAAPVGCDPPPAKGTLWAMTAPARVTQEPIPLCPFTGQVLLIVNTAAS